MKSCPQCRSDTFSFRENKPMQRLANDLGITCDDCSMIYKHGENHESSCSEKDIDCFLEFLGCKWRGCRRSLDAHLAEIHSPKCPNGHLLVKGKNTLDQCYFCDICGQTVVVGGFVFACEKCDYDECPGCFSHRPMKSLAPETTVGRYVDPDYYPNTT